MTADDCDADPEETVWLSGTSGSGERFFHTNRACQNLKRSATDWEMSREEAEVWGSECSSRWCGGPAEDNPGSNACPRCGESFRHLPKHLPTCSGGDGDV